MLVHVPRREGVRTLADLLASSRFPFSPSPICLSLAPTRMTSVPATLPRREEVMTLADLRHPNVMQFLGAVMKPPHLCMVTEHMPFSLHHVLYQVRVGVVCMNAGRPWKASGNNGAAC